ISEAKRLDGEPPAEGRPCRPSGKSRGPSMLKKRDRAFECFPHFGGITTAAHPSPAHIEELLKRVMPFPIPKKQINRQDEPLITTVLRLLSNRLGLQLPSVPRARLKRPSVCQPRRTWLVFLLSKTSVAVGGYRNGCSIPFKQNLQEISTGNLVH